MLTVLVLDDDAEVRETLEEALVALGYRVVPVADGAAALAALTAQPIDLILTDLKLTKESGLYFVNQARFQGYRQPVIVLTGYASKESAIEALRLGAVDFLEKPFEQSDLADALASAAERARESAPRSAQPAVVPTVSLLAACRASLRGLKSTENPLQPLDELHAAFTALAGAYATEHLAGAAEAARAGIRLTKILAEWKRPQSVAKAFPALEGLVAMLERAAREPSFEPRSALAPFERALAELERRIKLSG